MMGLMFVYPMTSLLMTQVLGYTPVQTGYYFLCYAVVIAIANAIGGKLCDIISRKKIVIICYAAVVVLMIIASFICRTPYVLVAIVLSQGFNGASQPAISALILDKSIYARRTESISMLYLASNIGSATGPILAGVLFNKHLPLVFICMAVAFALSGIITILMITDDAPGEEADRASGVKRDKDFSQDTTAKTSYLKIIFKNPVLLIYIIVLALSTFCYSSFGYMLPLHFTEFLGPEKGPSTYSLIWTINGFFIVLATPFIVRAIKGLSQLVSTAIACLLYAAAYGIYATTENVTMFYGAVLVWTAAEILVSTGAAIFIAAESPDTHKGRSMAAYEFARAVGRSTGPTVFGYIIMSRSFSATWAFNVIISIILFFVMIGLILSVRSHRQQGSNR